MSHYLSHMATLAVNQAPVVQPRLASRFEGSVGAAPVEDMQERVAAAPAARSNTAPVASPSPASTPVPDAQREPEVAPAKVPSAPLLQPQVTPLAKATATEALVQTALHTEPQLLVQELIHERIHEQPLLVAAPVSQNLVIPTVEKPGIETHREQSFFTEIRHELAVPEANPTPAKTASKRDAVPAANKAPQIQTRVAIPEPMAQSALRQPAPPAPSETPAPSIQVSIGRIEIRANPASSSPAAKPKSGPATLSLDDYLKQRKGDR